MKSKSNRLFLTLVVLMTAGLLHAANPPGIVSYQGNISVDGMPFDGTRFLKFALVNNSGAQA